ncbi:hypothetical protein E4634_12075 [Mangrovimicrobium sediminis]|uniref:Uncharacterized protein n=1 Tax=Mangrovimicrobium sediminis TaxID=2562682 RepID=A0A4Z0M0N7_9GAMM|nr:hypothetical protein [Haliea sp. SAOS-164]TGD73016.1 hypothetical protein E4634_12075 [Haliea sp. SAOS-164]
MLALLGRWTFGLTLGCLLTACTAENKDAACAAADILEDPGFTTLGGPRSQRRWSASQHASEPSFAYGVEDGVLTIRKTGKEPWFLLTQIVQDYTSLAGQEVEYSAEIRLDLQPPSIPHGFKDGGGLVLTALVGGRNAVNSVLEHEPHIGTSDWQRVAIRATLPRQINQLRLGILHQADGTLQVRNPQLRPANCAQ